MMNFIQVHFIYNGRWSKFQVINHRWWYITKSWRGCIKKTKETAFQIPRIHCGHETQDRIILTVVREQVIRIRSFQLEIILIRNTRISLLHEKERQAEVERRQSFFETFPYHLMCWWQTDNLLSLISEFEESQVKYYSTGFSQRRLNGNSEFWFAFWFRRRGENKKQPIRNAFRQGGWVVEGLRAVNLPQTIWIGWAYFLQCDQSCRETGCLD